MSNSFGRFIAVSLCIGLLVYGFGALAASQGDSENTISIRSDMNLLGFVGDQSGGGHVYWEIEGEAAQDLRRNILKVYDWNGNGILDEEEIYSRLDPKGPANGYVKDVERYIQTEMNEYVGAYIHGTKPINRDNPGGWIDDISGLLETGADSTDPIRINFIFDASNPARDEEVRLLENIFGEALFAPLPTGRFQGGAANFQSTDETDISSLWHLTNDTSLVHEGSSYPYTWWCGDPAEEGYFNNMKDSLRATLTLPLEHSDPWLSFNTRMILGQGDRGIVETYGENGWETLTEYTETISTWQTMEYDISDNIATGTSSLEIRFVFESDHTGTALGWFLDDIMIYDRTPEEIVSQNFTTTQDWNLGANWSLDNTTSVSGNYSLGYYSQLNHTTSMSYYGPIVLYDPPVIYREAEMSLHYIANLSANDTFSILLSEDGVNWTEAFFTNTTTEDWTEFVISLEDYIASEFYLAFNISTNDSLEERTVNIDDIYVAGLPIWWNTSGESDVDIEKEDLFQRNLWRYEEGSWICNDPGTDSYPGGLNNALVLLSTTSPMRTSFNWGCVSTIALSFEYRGMRTGDMLHVDVRTDNNWETIHSISSTSGEWTRVVLEEELQDYIGESSVSLRLRFVSRQEGGAGGLEVRNVDVNGEIYQGAYHLTHTHYKVGFNSFYSPSISKGSYILIRTPAGEIFRYSVTLAPGEEATDSIRQSAFNPMENPQILFVLFIVFGSLIIYFPKRSFNEYRNQLSYRNRILAKKSLPVVLISKLSVVMLGIFYFIPSLGRIYINGVSFLFIGIILIVVSAGISHLLYTDKTKKEVFEEPEEKTTPVSPPIPPPSRASAPHMININIPSGDRPEKKRVKKAPKKSQKKMKTIQCENCAEIFEYPEDWHDEINCPACGKNTEKAIENPLEKPLPERTRLEIPAYSSSIDCPICGAYLDVEGDERIETTCPSCDRELGITPHAIEKGYNYLLLDPSGSRAYNIFSDMSKKGSSLCLTTTFPGKIRREHLLQDTDIVWITDTGSEDEKCLNPRRLDFEITRTISEYTSKKNAVVFIDGLEFLIVENGFDNTMRFLKRITDIASMDDATLLVLIDPKTISLDDMSLLKREFDFVEDLELMKDDEDAI